MNALTAMTLFLAYGAPDPETGQNPNWRTFGFPGPISAPPDVPKTLEIHEPEPGSDETIEADVVHRRLGGGRLGRRRDPRGPRARRRRGRGRRLLQRVRLHPARASRLPADVLARRPDADGRGQRDASRPGPRSAAARRSTGPTACAPSRGSASSGRRISASTGSTAPSSTRHLDAVLERLGVNADCSDLNGPQQRMKEGCEALGWSFATITRNTDPSKYAPESAAYMGFGDQSGSKQSADRTWLADAQSHGAKLLHAHAGLARPRRGRARRRRRGRWLHPGWPRRFRHGARAARRGRGAARWSRRRC